MTEDFTEDQQAFFEAKIRDMVDAIGKEETFPDTQYKTIDTNIIEDVTKDPYIKPFRALFSHLLRLTKIDAKEKRTMQMQIKLMVAETEMELDTDDMDTGLLNRIESYGLFMNFIPNDSHEGFKLRELSRSRREVAWEGPKKEKRGWFR